MYLNKKQEQTLNMLQSSSIRMSKLQTAIPVHIFEIRQVGQPPRNVQGHTRQPSVGHLVQLLPK